MSEAEVSDKKETFEPDTESDDLLSRPPHIDAPFDHKLWPAIEAGLKEVYDPEIPVNVYELGLIYKIEIIPPASGAEGVNDVKVEMSLTSPACPLAHEIPTWVQGAILPVEGVQGCEVELVWEPAWNLGMMAETARMQLNMFM